jgi:predicted nucleotidyltransferase/HEPN domain-containing protein
MAWRLYGPWCLHRKAEKTGTSASLSDQWNPAEEWPKATPGNILSFSKFQISPHPLSQQLYFRKNGFCRIGYVARIWKILNRSALQVNIKEKEYITNLMKTSIEYLPEEKRADISEILHSIQRRLPAEMIMLFGSYARGDYVEDRYKENGTTYEYISDYDILVVVDTEAVAVKNESTKKWQSRVRRDLHHEISVNVIFHGIDYLNSEIESGNYFFLDILKEGVLLYDSGKFTLATPKALSPKERAQKAQLYFDRWFQNSDEFFDNYKRNYELDRFCTAAFELHQATERYYMCILLVYTNYKPKLHDLEKLNKQVCMVDDRFKAVFPRSTPEEDRMFILLKKAYIDSRYKLDYTITREELEYLGSRVLRLRGLTELACKEKIERFSRSETI